MRNKWLRFTLKVVNVLLTIGLFYFAYVYGKSLLSQADYSGLEEGWGALILAAGGFIGFYTASAFHWLMVCRIAEPEIKNQQMLAFFASQPYKYLPTSIFSFSFRAKYSKQLGLNFKKSSYSQMIENFNIISSGIVISILFFCFSQTYILGTVATLALFVLSYISRRYKIEIQIPFTKGRRKIHTYRLIPSFYLMCLAWMLAGISFWLVNISLDYPLNLWLAISACASAFVVSILAIFAPGGLGVRELTLALFSIPNSVVVLWRLLTFCADMILGLGAIILIRFIQKPQR